MAPHGSDSSYQLIGNNNRLMVVMMCNYSLFSGSLPFHSLTQCVFQVGMSFLAALTFLATINSLILSESDSDLGCE